MAKSKKVVAQKIVLAAATTAAITDAAGTQQGASDKWATMADLLHKDGVSSAMLVNPKKGGNKEVFDVVKTAVFAAFPSDVRSLFTVDVKSLSDSDKARKRLYTQRVGALMGNVKRALVTLERALETAANPTQKKVKSSPEQRARDKIADAIVILKALEEAKFMLPPVIDALEKVLIKMK